MDGQAYLQLLQQRLQRYFDSKPAPEELPFALVAELNAADEGYFIVPSIKTYSVQHNEYLYVQRFQQPLTMAMAQPYLNYLRRKMQNLVTTTEHMNSLFALVLVCENGLEPSVQQELTNFKYHKDYCFSLKGWSDLAVFIADLPQQKLSYNKAGRKTAAYFEFPR